MVEAVHTRPRLLWHYEGSSHHVWRANLECTDRDELADWAHREGRAALDRSMDRHEYRRWNSARRWLWESERNDFRDFHLSCSMTRPQMFAMARIKLEYARKMIAAGPNMAAVEALLAADRWRSWAKDTPRSDNDVVIRTRDPRPPKPVMREEVTKIPSRPRRDFSSAWHWDDVRASVEAVIDALPEEGFGGRLERAEIESHADSTLVYKWGRLLGELHQLEDPSAYAAALTNSTAIHRPSLSTREGCGTTLPPDEEDRLQARWKDMRIRALVDARKPVPEDLWG